MYKSIPEVFFETAKKFPNKTALLYKKEGVYFPIKYKEFAKRVIVVAGAFKSLGLEKGDKVAILSENRPEWAITDLATMFLGGVVVPLHTTFNPRAICMVLNHCKAKILVVSNEEFLNKVLLGQKDLKHLKKIVYLGKLTVTQKEFLTSKVLSWKAILSLNQDKACEAIFLDPDECCSIIYTSGTTGHPKGVVLTHRNFLSDAEAVNEVTPVEKGDIFLSFLPLSHVFERSTGYYLPLCYGATIAYAESTKDLPKNLKEIKPTVMISVPRVFEKFHDTIWDKVNKSSPLKKEIFKWALKQKKHTLRYKIGDYLAFKKVRQQMGGRLRLAISGGASLNENVGRFFSKIGVTILEGYGLTETSSVVSGNREHEVRFGTVGKVLPGVKVRITENKEILIKGPNIFGEYFKNKEQTKLVFDKEGWFCTGDMGFFDKQGYLTIIGRKKEMIVTSGGKNVWPEPVENFLNNDKFIAQSIVIGDKRKFISALIIPDWQEIEIYLKEQNLPLQEHDKLIKDPVLVDIFQKRIDEKINPNLSEVEKIKKFRLLPQEFSQDQDELTPTLKLRRHIIDNHYQKTIESIYAD